jgi:hypothetical protein
MKRLAALIGAGALLLGGIAAATPAQASVAGPPCSGSTCFGKSPYKFVNRDGTRCFDGAYAVPDRSTPSGLTVASPDGSTQNGAVLWYSPFCHANWVEVDPANGCGRFLEFKVEEADHQIQPMPGDGHFYTLMVDGTGQARAWIKCPDLLDDRWIPSHWA